MLTPATGREELQKATAGPLLCATGDGVSALGHLSAGRAGRAGRPRPATTAHAHSWRRRRAHVLPGLRRAVSGNVKSHASLQMQQHLRTWQRLRRREPCVLRASFPLPQNPSPETPT